ncbi:MAG TPA: 2OG-Fe(II) oxygenase [Myxococcales bacterium]|nr:2OG-Fe(II) oxygenase [Myxococcales bacterium]
MPSAGEGCGEPITRGQIERKIRIASLGQGASLSWMVEGRSIGSLDWTRVEADLSQGGYAVLEGVLTPRECVQIAAGYDRDAAFRSRVVMAQHGFGSGEYKYFAYPLPEPIATLRRDLYEFLAPIANRWSALLGKQGYPLRHQQFLGRCHAAKQLRPTPLLLRYGAGDYNCLHQDLYGELAFPLQVAFLLSQPGEDFSGGELVLAEQRPRKQSRCEVVPLRQGDGVAFAVDRRPVQGKRGVYQARMRHGVSRIRSGRRLTLGIIFHDAT